MNRDKVARVIARLDALNAQDPNRVEVGGIPRPHELVFADRLGSWIDRLRPVVPDELRIAARGQHVRRWTIPRREYPAGRAGYLFWREELKRMHAQTVVEVMREEGLSEAEISRVREIILKRERPTNPDVQTMEDALCLVFLETQFEDLRIKAADEKMVDIIRKTWKKMSKAGQEAALSLKIPDRHRELIGKALS